jgi:hypothetical protein
MKKKTFSLATTSSSRTTTHTFENGHAAEKVLLEAILPTPPSEETIARLNAIAREYPFCAYLKQNNNLYLL